MSPHQQLDAIILAGGEGRRVGGRDKGLLDWQGKPLIAWVIECIAPQVKQVYISANRNIEAYAAFGYAVHTDQSNDFRGPLAGIAACAAHCSSDWVLVVPCDCPALPNELAEKLLATAVSESLEASYAVDEARAHFLCAVFQKQALEGLKTRLQGDDLSVKGWLKTLRCKPTAFAGMKDAFLNLNTLESKRR